MELLVDAGNSRLKWAWWDGAEIRPGGDLAHAQELPADAREAWASVSLSAARVSCVTTPAFARQLRSALEQTVAELDWLVTPPAGLGLRNSYARPADLGIDRWLALAAAHARTGGAACVIDVGTAITLDVADAQGQHRGGLIAPGPQLLRDALGQATALPPPAAGRPAALGLVSGTAESIAMGSLIQACALIDRGAEFARRQAGADCRLWLTGGGAVALQPYLQCGPELAEGLVFEGLALRAREAGAG